MTKARGRRSTFSQVAWMLVLAIALVLAATALLMRVQGLAGGVEQVAPLVQSQVWLCEQLLARLSPDQLTRLPGFAESGLALRSSAPEAVPDLPYPFPVALAQAMRERLGAERVIELDDADPPRLWLQLRTRPVNWLGVSVPQHFARVRDSGLLILLGAALVVFAAAAWFARRLTRPLVALAGRAQAVLQGEPLPPGELKSAPREVHALAESLVQAGAAAHSRNRERDLMLAGLSHDLRTPLTRLRFALELGDGGPGETREAMIADVEELDALLGQFITYARGSGEAEQPALIDPATLALNLRQSRRQPWTIDLQALPPFRSRPLGLRRALGNLLDNAERHAAPPFECRGSVVDGAIEFLVRDHGPGLSAQQCETLRLPFARGDAARSGPGSGLGLAIVERFARSEGGELHLSTAETGGLQVQLRLPRSE